MSRRFTSGRYRSIGAKLLVLCTVAVFVAGMTAAFAADSQTAEKGGSKAAKVVAGDMMGAPAGLNSLVLDLAAATAAPGHSPESVLVGCPTTVLAGGQGTSGNGRAPHSNFLFIRSHYLITPAEMAASGFPSGAAPVNIGWTYSTGSGVAPAGTLVVYLENTADTTNLKSATWATAVGTMTTVHNAATILPAGSGPFTIPFSGGSPFTYTGGGLYVAFDWAWAGPTTTTAVVDCNTSLTGGLKGAQSNVAAPAAVAASSFRPATRFTPDIGNANDVSVDLVRAIGVLPTPLVGPQIFSATVSNKGTSAQANVPVTMAITGVDSFFDVFNVVALPACTGTATATFAAFTPAAIGANTVSVSVPADDFPGNDLKTKALDETYNRYSYKHPGSTASGGVGFNGGSGAFVAAFPIAQPASVTEVELEFFSVTITTYRVAIYGDAAGAPGTTALYLDAADRTVAVAGPVVITLPAPVPVPAGRFYVGIHQTNTTNASLSFDTENPLRTDRFYVAGALPVVGWSDFAPANAFKLNIGVRLVQCGVAADCNDNNVCTDEVCQNELCVYTNNTSVCNDGNACTSGDVCAGGVCVPGANPCEDNNACTTDVCDGVGGCTYPPVVCDDNNPCTTDSCIPATGCDFAPISGPACTDNNVCTIGDFCVAGACVPGPLPPATQFCNAAAVTIPSAGPASAYPMPISVAGLGSVCKVTVSINGIFHTWPADLDVLLSGPAGQNSIVMSDVGGNGAIAAPGVFLTFDDAAANSLTTAALVNGTYKPTNRGTGDVWPAPAPVPIGGTALSIFNGTAPTGTWNLWVSDQFSGDSGGISGGWCINITGSPCVTNGDCDDSNACNGVETCNAGVCQSGTPIVCNDGLFCTLDSCTPSTGACVFAPNPCGDGDICTADACDEAGDTCVYTNSCVQVCSTGPITIPPGGPATPYPSPIVVTGVTYPAVLASVELQGFSHLFPDDIDVLLEGPVDPSQNIKLMSDAGGGTPVTGLNLKFADGAPAISNAGPLFSGTFSPADYAGGTDAFPAPAPAFSGFLTLALFNGNPNGTFKLYVNDEFTPDDGAITGWCVNILPIGCTDASVCDDGNFCTADSCEGGTCVNVLSTAVCDDFNPCTSETCSQADGCGYFPVTCDDGLACTTDTCVDFVGCNFAPSGPADAVGNTLLFSTTADLDWTAEPAGPFNVYRGSVAASYDHTCFSSLQAPKTVADPAVPSLGSLYYYLVSRDNACGESGLGSGTAGPRPNTSPCP